MLRKFASVLVLTALFGFALPLMGCPAREKSLSEKAEDAAEDAGEAVQDAAEDAGDAVKDATD